MTALAEQQRLIQAAIDAIDNRTPRRWDDNNRVWLRFALSDHEDPEEGCSAGPGEECAAVEKARRILAGDA